ncbi:MAG: serine/threonine-protein kinase [Deltaproteobacteria bacterium]|nr:serine/threonine-protein kinase [Deltaproteobacteria bacterium]
MDPKKFQAAETLFHQALELPPEARATFLEKACGDDATLYDAVSELIAVEPGAESRLDGVVRRKAIEMAPEGGIPEAVNLPQRIGPYRVLGQLGRGGQGVVLLAERDDEAFHKKVAIKVLRGGLDTGERAGRFRRERQILARLEHPAIARVLDGGTSEDGSPYVVMEHVEGEPIDSYCIRRDLGVEETLDLFCRAAEAVEAAHRQLVIHRDLKPSNLLVTAAGEPKLLDFGISQLLDEDDSPEVDLTVTGRQPLTPGFASPEQVRGQHLTTATDIYSLGILLYRLLTRQQPYRLQGRSPAEIERIITETKPGKPSAIATAGGDPSLGRRLRGDLDTIVLKALRKEPEQRYGTVAELVDDLRRHQSGLPVRARGETVRYRLGKFLARNRLPVAVAAAATLLFATLVTFYTLQLRAERDRATLEAVRADQGAAESEAVTQLVTELFALADPNSLDGQEMSASQLLERGVELTRRIPADQPAIRGRLLGFLADVHVQWELYDPARELLDERLELYRSHSSEPTPEIAATLTALGKLEIDRHGLPEARDFLDRAHSAWQALGQGASQPALQTRLYQFELLQATDSPIDSKDLEKELVEISADLQNLVDQESRRLAPDHPDLARVQRLLADSRSLEGDLALDQRDPNRAAERYRVTLGLLQEALGPAHLDVAATWNNLAVALQRAGLQEQSLSARQKQLEIHRQLLGDSSYRLALGLWGLGVFQLRHGQPEKGLEACREALAMTRSLGGEEHPNVPQLLRCVALGWTKLGETEEAAAAYGESVRIVRRIVADDRATPWSLSTALFHLGVFALREGRTVTADEALRECTEIRRAENPNAPGTHQAVCLSQGAHTSPHEVSALVERCTS